MEVLLQVPDALLYLNAQHVNKTDLFRLKSYKCRIHVSVIIWGVSGRLYRQYNVTVCFCGVLTSVTSSKSMITF